MGAQYAVLMENQTISAATTLIAGRPATSRGFKILRAWAKQSGGATSAQCRIEIGRKVTTLPSALTSATIQKLDERDGASAFTGGTDMATAGKWGTKTTTEGGGTLNVLVNEGFNNLTGFEWTPVFEEMVFVAGSADCFVMRFSATPSPTGNWDAGVYFEEL